MTDKIMVVHLSSADQLKVGKAISFAEKALSYASSVFLILSAEGVLAADKSKETFVIPALKQTALDVLRQFIKDGGRIVVGTDCMKNLSIGAANLLAGCEPAEPDYIFNLLLSDQTVIMSW